MIKKYIPDGLKIRLHLLKNAVRDFSNGYMFSFAKRKPRIIDESIVFSLTQDLKSNEFKKQNILKAKSFIDHVTIWPDQIFSFWKIVGNPSKKRGFVQSRSLVNGETIESYGGGLCQLSGLIYLTSIHCGLEILERHNHSTDIYDDTTRYMPLGGDATVAYGHKDLKIRNNFKEPIRFAISTKEDTVSVGICSAEQLTISKIDFTITHQDSDIKVVDTLINGEIALTSTYKNLLPK
ncbi:VanW family protein [Schleiferiaceae bacterium]|jgi:vancomycin resistance protein VanW|nr:VanW family protein [Schleiferiaceae bacterium]